VVTDVLMSIRPVYVDAIFAGTKTVELRRRRPSFGIGTRVLVYSTAPEQRIHGTFDVGGVLHDAPPVLWRAIKDRAGVDRATFDAYFAGCQEAYAIQVENPRRIDPAVLPIRPPQSYQFLRPQRSAHRDVLRLAPA
jgi:predicted transcriptional regulator